MSAIKKMAPFSFQLHFDTVVHLKVVQGGPLNTTPNNVFLIFFLQQPTRDIPK